MKQLNFLKLRNFTIVLIVLIISISCKTREKNYITYYQKVVEIDSIYRLADKPKVAVRKYKRLFRKYEPKHHYMMDEFGTYIELSDRYNKNFGGKESLKKLIHILAPGAEHRWHVRYYPLLNKYGMDSLEIEKEFAIWRNGFDKELLDSFSIAIDRDQKPLLAEERGQKLIELSRKQNFQLLKWAFENRGYPSVQKIGNKANYHALWINLSGINEYENLKSKLFEYVKSGDCPPVDYATLIDYHENGNKRRVQYLMNANDDGIIDSAFVNKNRKELGLPSIKHSVKIRKDFWAKMKENYQE